MLKYYVVRILTVFLFASWTLAVIMRGISTWFGQELSRGDYQAFLVGCGGALFASVMLALNHYFNSRIDKRLERENLSGK